MDDVIVFDIETQKSFDEVGGRRNLHLLGISVLAAYSYNREKTFVFEEKNLSQFKELGFPLLIGPSRKSYLGKILGSGIDDRLEGTLAAVTVCVLNGADIIRVHDVKECKKAVAVAGAITKA